MGLTQSEELLCQNVASIIKDYRREELSESITAAHVKKWIKQFPTESRELLLSETANILSDWYFDTTYIKNSFFRDVVRFVTNKYGFVSENLVFREAVFLNLQECGKSQDRLLRILEQVAISCFNESIITDHSLKRKHYIYIDDGLYTGRTSIREIRQVVELLPYGSTLDCFFLVAGSNGLAYNYKTISPIAKEHGIELALYRHRILDNIPYAEVTQINATTKEETYSFYQHCMWPTNDILSDSDIAEFATMLDNKKAKYLFRDKYWKNDKGIFTSSDARNEIERIFIRMGIKLLNGKIGNDCLYPLGFHCFSSWGFGSFLASDLNISNTCPLVLWSEASGWNPLFPRRTKYNSHSDVEMIDFENWSLTENDINSIYSDSIL